MSQENVAVARASIDAYDRRDFETLQRLNEPDVELDRSASMGLDARAYHGQKEAMRFYKDFFETFERIDLQPDREALEATGLSE